MRWASGLACASLMLTASLAVGGATAARAQTPPQEDAPPALVEASPPTAPVELDGVELFRVRGVSSFPADRRAQAIRDRIAAAAADPAISIEAIRITVAEAQLRISAGDRPIMAVLPADARVEQVSEEALALAHLQRVRQAVASYRDARSGAALRGATIRSVLATFVLLLAILASLVGAAWLNRLLTRRLESRIHSIGIQSFELMRAERIAAVLRSSITGLRGLALLVSVLVYLGYVLAQWPWTRGLSRQLVAFVFAPVRVIADGIVRNIPSVIFLVVLFFVVRLALRLIRLFFEAVSRGAVKFAGFDADWALPTYKIVRVLVVAFGLIVAYPYIPGSESDAFKGVSLFLGIVFSLGSSGAIANIIAGFMMTYRRAFKIGDRIKIGEAMGEVLEVRLQVTHLRSPKNEELVIPNSQVLTSEVRNYSSLARTRGLILHTEVGIGYETPWRQVEAMLREAAGRTAGLSHDLSPFVLIKKLGDFAVGYELNVYTGDPTTMHLQYTELHRNILDVFNEYGVQIMTPAYESDPASPKVVPPSSWYAEPAPRPAEPASRPTKTAAASAS